MKYFVIFVLLTLSIACLQENKKMANEKQISQDVLYGEQLIENGFLKYAETMKLDSLKLSLINSFDIYNEENNKIAPIDAEELAEFSFDFFLPRLNKMLKKRAFQLDVKTTNDYERTNDIFINGEKVNLYTKEELEEGNFWELASRRFFKVINKQLHNEKIEESFYLLYGGNDLNVLLLTENQQKIIAVKYKNDSKEIPYLP